MPRTDSGKGNGRNQLQSRFTAFESSPNHLLLTSIPPFPDTILGNEEAEFWWTYYCGLMIECGTLSRLFLNSLKNLCSFASIIIALEHKLQEQGLFIDIPRKFNGQEYVDEVSNPIIDKLTGLYLKYDSLCNSLGFTLFSSKLNAIDALGKGDTSPADATPPPSGFTPEKEVDNASRT